ncbi:MAG: TetR/AcrR family transcriptional regulator [Deltaproteobacteria bacterium]|nr:TetR/AcrR family transcriptional regulator [Deltaproteobacteria bacterium]
MGLKERRAREKEARRRQIVDAARSLLFQEGLQATSINQIAKQAELAVGTIYFYYSSKEDLFAELQEEGLHLLIESIRANVSDAGDPMEQLTSMAMAYYNFSREQKDYFDVINYFLSSRDILLSPDLKQRVDAKIGEILAQIESVLSRMRTGQDGGTSGLESRGALFLAALHGLMQLQKFENTVFKGMPHRELYRGAVKNLIKGLGAR